MHRSVRAKIKSIKDYLIHGEIKLEAKAHNIETKRAYEIASGRKSPRPHEFGFINSLIDRALPRIKELSRLNNFPEGNVETANSAKKTFRARINL